MEPALGSRALNACFEERSEGQVRLWGLRVVIKCSLAKAEESIVCASISMSQCDNEKCVDHDALWCVAEARLN